MHMDQILGIDIGGSGIKGGVVNVSTGTLLTERHKILTEASFTPLEIAKVIRQMTYFFEWSGPVGCTFPSVITQGRCISHGNMHRDWLGLNIEEFFSQTCSNPFFCGNDADLAGLAESKHGAAKNEKGKVLLVTVGTGIGTAMIFKGEIIPNFELGRSYFRDLAPFEYFASANAKNRDNLSLKEWAGRLNIFLNHSCMLISPDFIILGGGISRKFEQFKTYISIPAKIVPAAFKNKAGVIGAALYAEMRIKNEITSSY